MPGDAAPPHPPATITIPLDMAANMHCSIASLDKARRGARIGSPKGMSLIELMICTGMLILLGILGAPSIRMLALRHRAIAAEHALIGNLQLARSAAISYRKDAVLCPSLDAERCSGSSDWSTGLLLFLDADGDREPNTTSDIVRTDSFPAGSLRVTSSRGRHLIRYLPDGRSAGTNLTISVCGKSGATLKQVIVNNAGRVRSQRPKEPRNCPD